MRIFNFKKKVKKHEIKEVKPAINIENIKIQIINESGIFENEKEIIFEGAKDFFEKKAVNSIEEGIIMVATTLRGLRYIETKIDEDGKKCVILRDQQKVISKVKC